MGRNTTKLSPHFEAWEFECPHCHQLPEGGIDQGLLDRLEALRDRVGKAVHVTSGYRCAVENDEIGGAPDSRHLHGDAADIFVVGVDTVALALLAHGVDFDGIGLYDRHIHVDTRGWKAAWDERGKP